MLIREDVYIISIVVKTRNIDFNEWLVHQIPSEWCNNIVPSAGLAVIVS